jgi:hypothetical protein
LLNSLNDFVGEHERDIGVSIRNFIVKLVKTQITHHKMEEKQSKKKLFIRKIIKIILVVVLIGGAQYYFVKQKPVSNELTALVTKYNSACPVMISDAIRMESVNELPDNTVQYDLLWYVL